MPEGDTLRRTAARLSPVLVGRTVTDLRSPDARLAALGRLRLVGRPVEAVEARGKHLFIRVGSAALHTHLGMTGSWHLYRAGSPWRAPRHLARVVLEAGDVLAVCFLPRTMEILTPAEEAAHPALGALGPDVRAKDFDEGEAVRRLRERPALTIAEALLDQEALAGIGNIYKSEALFLAGLNPLDRVGALGDEDLHRAVGHARRQMARNVATGPRRTTPEAAPARTWVYGRAARPCRRCGTRIVTARQGELRRVSYWCPRCQRPRSEEGARAAAVLTRGGGWPPSSSPPRRRSSGRGRRA